MKYFFPDSQDLVDPSFDFEREQWASDRVRQRTEAYAHEVHSTRAYDGLLLSKAFVEGYGGTCRISMAQRQRLFRVGAPEFLRAKSSPWGPLPVMGDCGAFAYVREKVPPYSVDEVLNYYVEYRMDFGLSVDHVILAYQPSWDVAPATLPDDISRRQEITFELADEFLKKHKRHGLAFEPIGVAQGWSSSSYAHAVATLQRMGYRYVALGGMVGLKSSQILDCLKSISGVKRSETRLHLLGITRVDHISGFAKYGVTSFDSTSPLRQSFKDDKDNFYTLQRNYTAIRIPQVEGNRRLQQQISSGKISQQKARRLEQECLRLFREFNHNEAVLEELLAALRAYEELYDPGKDHTAVYRETLIDQPWRSCHCDVCRSIGYHVILFRGAERNRRRGFHNVWVFYQRLQSQLGVPTGQRAASHSASTAQVAISI